MSVELEPPVRALNELIRRQAAPEAMREDLSQWLEAQGSERSGPRRDARGRRGAAAGLPTARAQPDAQHDAGVHPAHRGSARQADLQRVHRPLHGRGGADLGVPAGRPGGVRRVGGSQARPRPRRAELPRRPRPARAAADRRAQRPARWRGPRPATRSRSIDRCASTGPSGRIDYDYAVHELPRPVEDRSEPTQAPTALLVYRDEKNRPRYLDLIPLAAALLDSTLVG